MVNKKGEITIEKLDDLTENNGFDDEEEVEKADNNFELKKWGANVWSDIPELNRDFTLSNLSDAMFDSRVVNFIRNRVFLVKMLNMIFKYAQIEVSEDNKEGYTEAQKERIKYETRNFIKTRNIILAEVYTILNLSKARGGLVLKAFLEGGMSQEEMENIAGDGVAVGEEPKRSWMDRLLGKNRKKKEVRGRYVQ